MTTRLIGLTGYKYAGKDTAGQLLCDMLPGAQRLAFADALKLSIHNAYNFTLRRDLLDKPDTKETLYEALRLDGCLLPGFVFYAMKALGSDDVEAPRSPRTIMQLYGQWKREEDRDYWVKALHQRRTLAEAAINARHLLDDDAQPITFIITDVRYVNEAAYILEHGGHIARVLKPQSHQATDAHSSEQGEAFPLADFKVWNDGTLDDLRIECSRLVKELAMEVRT